MKKIKCLLAGLMLACMVIGVTGFGSGAEKDMVEIPGKNIKMLKTEVTQGLYESVMGENPSFFKIGRKEYEEWQGKPYELPEGWDEKQLPVECVSWFDAIYFCNKLSEKKGLKPVYAVDGETNVTKWNYTPHKGNWLDGKVTQNTSASGYRLPTGEEWEYAARGGENYTYAGSNDVDEVAWHMYNSDKETHPVAQKKANGYGLYDMSGNVWEWLWDVFTYYGCDFRYDCGGGWNNSDDPCEVDVRYHRDANFQDNDRGFRIVRSSK